MYNRFFFLVVFFLFCSVAFAQDTPKPRHLNFWCPPSQYAQDYWNVTIHQFMATRPDIEITINWNITWANIQSELDAAMIKGTEPDMIWAGNTFIGAWNHNHYLNPFTSYMREWKRERQRDFTLDYWKQVPYDYYSNEEWWALPMVASSWPLYWRTDLVSQVIGVNRPPATWDELYDWAQRINATTGVWGHCQRYSGALSNYLMPIIQSFGGSAFTDDLRCGLDTNQSKAGIDYITKFYRNGLAPSANLSETEAHLNFKNGKCAFIVAGPWMYPEFIGLWTGATNLSFAMNALPAGPFGKYAFLGGEAMVSVSTTRYPDDVWAFSKWFSQQNGGQSSAGINTDSTMLTEENCPASALPQYRPENIPSSSWWLKSVPSVLEALPYAVPIQFPNGNNPAVPAIQDDLLFAPMLQRINNGEDLDIVVADSCEYMNARIATLTEPIYPVWDGQEPFEIAFTIFLSICLALAITGALLTFVFREHTLIWISSPLFSGIIWVGCIMGYVALFFFTYPATQSRCLAKYWLGFLSFTFIYAALFTKNWRLWRMVDSAMKFRVNRISILQTLVIVGLISSPVIILLILWSAIDTLDVEWVPVSNDSYKQLMCTSDHYWVWQGILFGYISLVCIFGLYIAFVVRKLSRGLSEARAINFSLLSSALVAVVVIPLVYGLEESPEAVIILAVVGGGVAITLIWLMLYGEKFYQIARGKEPTRSELSSGNYRNGGSIASVHSSTTPTTFSSARSD